MTRSAALAACLCGLAITASAAARSSSIERHTVSVGNWRLTLIRDPFSQELYCRLVGKNGRTIYQHGAVGFRFKRTWDVGAAVYRIDGAPPHQSRDDLPTLIELGTPIDNGGLANPSAGTVWIPYTRLAEANSVAIEPQPTRRALTFHFRGLAGLRRLARERGCTPESRFVL